MKPHSKTPIFPLSFRQLTSATNPGFLTKQLLKLIHLETLHSNFHGIKVLRLGSGGNTWEITC